MDVYFSIDCEASGPVPPLYNLLSIGATVVRDPGGDPKLGESFYVELVPIFPGFDAGALAVCGLDPERLRREGVEPSQALRRLAAWVDAQRGDSPAIFVGHNAVFDWSQIAYYFAHFGLPNPFGYKGIDTKSMAMGQLGIPWEDTSKERLQGLLDLPEPETERIHRADYDAWYQALILAALLRRRAAAGHP